ncbi:hypothetical protein [uncultured Psychroserpens sp.]|uniref:DUF7672 family protein n=1 Tax=uncultured Psychroserpens sp. TaxID=255436 RepID=UPI002625E750|nr:hypothetical protein [uncultured Psychroserpens sp.]
MLKLYIIGISILITAIIANAVVIKIGLKSWYDFIELLSQNGSSSLSQLSVLDYIWLFLGYPLILGCGYWVGSKCYDWFFS